MCISQACIRDWAIYCSSKNTSALIRWNKIMAQRWKWVLKIFSNVVYNLLLSCRNTHAGMNCTTLYMKVDSLSSLPTYETPHGVMFETLPYVWDHLTGGHLQQSSGLPAFKYPGNPFSHTEWLCDAYLARSWLAGPRSHCMKSAKSCKMFLQAWDLGLGIQLKCSRRMGKPQAMAHFKC